jgi:large subunit ribosomal protein L35Ae
MEAVIANYRRSRTRQYPNQVIIETDAADSRESAEKLVGKKVSWTSPAGVVIEGSIVAAHGGKGAVRAIMERGLPGQSLGQPIVVA